MKGKALLGKVKAQRHPTAIFLNVPPYQMVTLLRFDPFLSGSDVGPLRAQRSHILNAMDVVY